MQVMTAKSVAQEPVVYKNCILIHCRNQCVQPANKINI